MAVDVKKVEMKNEAKIVNAKRGWFLEIIKTSSETTKKWISTDISQAQSMHCDQS